MGDRLWVSASDNLNDLVNDLVREYSFPRSIAVFLAVRGITPDQVDQYLKPTLASLSDPFRFPGIDRAVERLWKAIQNGELIIIHGDYDTDGITATALLAWVFQHNGAKVDTFLPHRFEDGYGFTCDTLNKALENAESPCKVLVTVDCGINSIEAVAEANRQGLEVIITDHHDPTEQLPEALAIINPKVYDELKDLQLLSGVGAAFKLCHAFVKYGRDNNLGGFTTDLQEVLDLVALGTIADIVPLLGENRILVRHGIKALKRQLRPGVRALIEVAGVSQKLRPSDVTFKLAPRINAAGRLGNANTALTLLNSENIVEAYQFANQLEDFNVRRQEKEQEIFDQAKQQINTTIDIDNSFTILVAGENWHQGVIGIVASRLSREYNRPAIVLTIQGEEAHGSGRSIGKLNLVKILSDCASLLDRFGGHPMAVGLGMKTSMIPDFTSKFETDVRQNLSKSDLVDQVEFDGELTMSELDDNFFELLDKLGPFGHGNPQPVYRLNNLETVKALPAGERHTRGTVRDSRGNQLDFIAFNRQLNTFPPTNWDVIATPQINEYYGTRKPQLQILDVRSSY